MAGLRRWSVVLIILALFLLYNREIPLTTDERSFLTSIYQETHHVYQIQARYYSRDQIKVRMLATSLKSGTAEQINLLYDRQQQHVLTAEKKPYGTPVGEWAAKFAMVFAILALWLLYLDPLLGGMYCPTCRWFGILPRILKEKERTLFPSVLADDGDYTPEIIEREWACPTCSFREYSVREQSISMQSNLLTELKGSVNAYQSVKESEQEIESLEKRAKATGISREQHLKRLETAMKEAVAKSTPRF